MWRDWPEQTCPFPGVMGELRLADLDHAIPTRGWGHPVGHSPTRTPCVQSQTAAGRSETPGLCRDEMNQAHQKVI